MYDSYSQDFEPTVAGAAWQYRWLVLFLAIGFAGVGWLLASNREAYTATAAILVEDPRSSNLFDGGTVGSPERYVRSQAEIMSSLSVAQRASEIAALADPPVVVSADDIGVQGLIINSDEDSGLIRISYTAENPNSAVEVVNAISVAYQELGRELAASEFETVIQELDSRIVLLTIEGQDLQEELRRLRTSDAERLAIQDQLEGAISRLLLLETTPSDGLPEDYAQTAAELSEIGLQIATLRAALANQADDPAIQALETQSADVQNRIISLREVRDQRAVDAQLISSGVVFYDPAVEGIASSAATLVIFGFLMGSVLGAAVAVPLARRRRRFSSRIEPESALGAPLLADIPSFFEERLSTNLPTVEAAASAAAESFRFVASAIALQRDRSFGDDKGPAFTSVVVTSTAVSEGKTTVVANTAFAAAREGSRVLVIDADFADQSLTRLMVGSAIPDAGLAEVVTGMATLDEALVSVPMEDAGSVDLLHGGKVVISAFDLLSSGAVEGIFAELGQRYNLILIDGPPLPRVAYSTTLVRLADRALVVVAHGEDIRGTQELRRQLNLIETPVLGYVYNLAPLRPEMALALGSTRPPRDRSSVPDEVSDDVELGQD